MKNDGFTIVELLAVISILAILIIIAVPAYNSVNEDTKMASLENKKNAIKIAMLNYANKNLLDEIKPEGDICADSNPCCKAYSVEYILKNNIYYTDEQNKIEYNPITNEVLIGYVEVYFNIQNHKLNALFNDTKNVTTGCDKIEYIKEGEIS